MLVSSQLLILKLACLQETPPLQRTLMRLLATLSLLWLKATAQSLESFSGSASIGEDAEPTVVVLSAGQL